MSAHDQPCKHFSKDSSLSLAVLNSIVRPLLYTMPFGFLSVDVRGEEVYIDLELREKFWPEDTNLGIINIKMVFKVMRLDKGP